MYSTVLLECSFIVIVVIKDTPVSYGTVRCQLVKEVKLLGLGKLTLHSARIEAQLGGPRLGSVGRVSRPAECGGYIRMKEPGVTFFYRMLERL